VVQDGEFEGLNTPAYCSKLNGAETYNAALSMKMGLHMGMLAFCGSGNE
jgi:hypothetical protein